MPPLALAGLLGPHTRLIVPALAAGMMLLEYGFGRVQQRHSHDLGETAATFAVALGRLATRDIEALLLAIPFGWVYRHRLFDIDLARWWALPALLFLSELLYYWEHRASHRIRWMWATHAVHHSPTKLNLTAAIRLGWTGSLSGNFLFLLPLVWLGFNPVAVVAMLAANLFYQFFIHTELAPSLGPLEWALNTPSHHQVHHASNTGCLDKNYGGILIVFDRMFGSFAATPQDETLRYGLAGGVPTINPIRIALGEWAAMYHDLTRAPDWPSRWRALFAPPAEG